MMDSSKRSMESSSCRDQTRLPMATPIARRSPHPPRCWSRVWKTIKYRLVVLIAAGLVSGPLFWNFQTLLSPSLQHHGDSPGNGNSRIVIDHDAPPSLLQFPQQTVTRKKKRMSIDDAVFVMEAQKRNKLILQQKQQEQILLEQQAHMKGLHQNQVFQKETMNDLPINVNQATDSNTKLQQSPYPAKHNQLSTDDGTAGTPVAVVAKEPFNRRIPNISPVNPGDASNTMWSTLQYIIQLLQASQVDYFLMAGSLLSFSRANQTPPWYDQDIDLAVSTKWLQAPGNFENLHVIFQQAGLIWKRNSTGIDGTPLTLGGSIVYLYNTIEIELVATELRSHVFVNGFVDNGYHLACPKPFQDIQSLPWGASNLMVRVPMPYHRVLVATYGPQYQVPLSKRRYEGTRMMNATRSGRCMIVHKDRFSLTRNNTTRATSDNDKFQRGFLVVLTNREDVAQSLVLAKQLQKWWKTSTMLSALEPQPLLEIYHNGTLSYHLEARFELYSFVAVVNLEKLYTGPYSQRNNHTENTNKETILYFQALYTTKLRHVLWVPPGIQFLYNPLYLLQTMQYIHAQHAQCQSLQLGSSCVTSLISKRVKEVTDFVIESNSLRIQMVRKHAIDFSRRLLLNQTSISVAHLPHLNNGVAYWIQPTSNFSKWAHDDLFRPASKAFVWEIQQKNSTDALLIDLTVPREYVKALQSYWFKYQKARRFLLLDRPMEWVAFDGGLFWQFSTMNSKKAANQTYYHGSLLMNLDVTISLDEVLVATHNNNMLTPYPFPGNDLLTPISNLTFAQLRNMSNPCLPEQVAREWLYDNSYQHYRCQPEKIMRQDDFILYSVHAEVMYDLKAPTGSLQIKQAEAIQQVFLDFDETLLENGHVSVRFFETSKDNLKSSVLPDHALRALSTSTKLQHISYYVSTPSDLACAQIMHWIYTHAKFVNKNVLGCYVIVDNTGIVESWKQFVQTNEIPLNSSLVSLPSTPSGYPDAKTICDIPRKQSTPNRTFWQHSYIACVEAGYTFVMHPWYVTMVADFDAMPTGLEAGSHQVESKLWTEILPPRLQETVTANDSVWSDYNSHWGFMFLSDWEGRYQRWFQGAKSLQNQKTRHAEQAIFRCITKVLVTMLLLRLEELNLANLDDAVLLPIAKEDGPGRGNGSATWRHVLSNTAGSKGQHAGSQFDYDNEIWQYVPAYVEAKCGLNFVLAMQYYILNPMGLTGYFQMDTPTPPVASRGFVGSMDDLLVIGGTFVSLGISPKTRKQVLTAKSIEQIKTNAILQSSNPDMEESFVNHRVTKSMSRFLDKSATGESLMPSNEVMSGYGLGLWCVQGWRRTLQGAPIRGWIGVGSSETLLYFDITGMVLAFSAPKRVMGYELTAVFAKVVRDVGDLLLQQQQD